MGGFSASDWLFSQIRLHLQALGIELVRPESLAYVVFFRASVRVHIYLS